MFVDSFFVVAKRIGVLSFLYYYNNGGEFFLYLFALKVFKICLIEGFDF